MKEEKLIWTNLPKKQAIEIFGNLDEALKNKDDLAVQKILQNPEALRTLIVGRRIVTGPKFPAINGLDKIEEGFDFLLEKKYGKRDVTKLSDKEIIDAVHDAGLPEQILVELASAAYHKRKTDLFSKARFFKFESVVLDSKGLVKSKEVINAARHNLATWRMEEEGDASEALKLNKEVLQFSENDILLLKAKMGLVVHKKLRPKYKANDYENIAREMIKKEHFVDAFRAKIEQAKALLLIAENVSGKARTSSDFEESMVVIGGLIKEVLEYAEEYNYVNLKILALEASVRYLKLQGNDKKKEAGDTKAKAIGLREKSGYVTGVFDKKK